VADIVVLLVGSRAVSLVGDLAFRIAFIAYVLKTSDGSAVVLGLATAALIVPSLVFYPLGGVVGDRARSPQLVMVASDCARAAAVALVALLAHLGVGALLIVAAASLVGVGEAFSRPASVRFVAQVVPRKSLVRVNSAMMLGQQAALIVGPALGALLIAASGQVAVFALDAGTFLASAAMVSLAHRRARPAPVTDAAPEPAGTLRTGATPALKYILRLGWLRSVLLIGGTAGAVFAGALNVTVPLLLGGADAGRELGFFYAMEGVGAVVGAILLARTEIVRAGIVLFCAMAGMAVALGLTGLFLDGPGTYAMGFAYGLGANVFGSVYLTVLQSNVTPELMSRVGSLGYLTYTGFVPVGVTVTGWLVSLGGPRAATLGTGVFACIICLIPLAMPSIRALTIGDSEDPARSGSRELHPGRK
jgi:MFS family permease